MWRTILIILSPILVLAVAIVGYVYFIVDRQAMPLCQKQLLMAVENWLEKERTTIAPNINGRSADSFAAFSKELGDEQDREWPTKYRYVPGLQKGDPNDLVLAYFAQPTRFLHHASFATRFDERRWIIVPLDFASCYCSLRTGGRMRNIPVEGECSENLTLAEFRQRLQKTLDYLRENDRPHWQTVVEEHTKFLESIPAE